MDQKGCGDMNAKTWKNRKRLELAEWKYTRSNIIIKRPLNCLNQKNKKKTKIMTKFSFEQEAGNVGLR